MKYIGDIRSASSVNLRKMAGDPTARSCFTVNKYCIHTDYTDERRQRATMSGISPIGLCSFVLLSASAAARAASDPLLSAVRRRIVMRAEEIVLIQSFRFREQDIMERRNLFLRLIFRRSRFGEPHFSLR